MGTNKIAILIGPMGKKTVTDPLQPGPLFEDIYQIYLSGRINSERGSRWNGP